MPTVSRAELNSDDIVAAFGLVKMRGPAAVMIDIVDSDPEGSTIDVVDCRNDVVFVLNNAAAHGAHFFIGPQDHRLEISQIVRVTAEYFGVEVADILSHRRDRESVRARQVAMYLARAQTLRSFPEIGRCFRGRDHSTIQHAFKKMAARLDRDADIARDIDFLTVKLTGEVLR